jgi:hypothetical protein
LVARMPSTMRHAHRSSWGTEKTCRRSLHHLEEIRTSQEHRDGPVPACESAGTADLRRPRSGSPLPMRSQREPDDREFGLTVRAIRMAVHNLGRRISHSVYKRAERTGTAVGEQTTREGSNTAGRESFSQRAVMPSRDIRARCNRPSVLIPWP